MKLLQAFANIRTDSYLSKLIPRPLPPPGPGMESLLFWPGLEKAKSGRCRVNYTYIKEQTQQSLYDFLLSYVHKLLNQSMSVDINI